MVPVGVASAESAWRLALEDIKDANQAIAATTGIEFFIFDRHLASVNYSHRLSNERPNEFVRVAHPGFEFLGRLGLDAFDGPRPLFSI